MVTQCRRHHRQYPSILEDIRTSLEQLQCSRCITVAGSEDVLHWVALHIYIPVQVTHNPQVHLPAVDS